MGRYCWGILFALIHGVAHFQVLQSVTGMDTRQLFTTSYDLPGAQSKQGLNPLQLASIARLKIQTDTFYDDVYREDGTLEQSEVYRMGNVSYFEIPVGAKWGGVGFEFVRTDVCAHQANQYDEESTLAWIDQRASVGIGGNAFQRKLRFGSLAGFTLMEQEWRPHYTVELAWQPQTTLNLALNMGRQPGYRNAEWRAADTAYPATIGYLGSWWGAAVRFGFLEYTNLKVEIRRERLSPNEYAHSKEGFILQPEMILRSIRARAQVRPSAAISLYVKWHASSVTGSGEALNHGQQFGDLVSLVIDNSELEFIGTWRRSRKSLFIFTFSHFNLDARQSGHLDPWPFSASALNRFERIYYRGSGQVRAERGIAEYVMNRRIGEAALQLGRVWLVPDPASELEQRRTLLILFDQELVSSSLNILRAEFTVIGGRVSVPVGKMTLSYTFNQAFPTHIARREPEPAKPPAEKVEVHGGSYHRLRLSILL